MHRGKPWCAYPILKQPLRVFYTRKTDGSATVRFFLYKYYISVKNIDRGVLIEKV